MVFQLVLYTYIFFFFFFACSCIPPELLTTWRRCRLAPLSPYCPMPCPCRYCIHLSFLFFLFFLSLCWSRLPSLLPPQHSCPASVSHSHFHFLSYLFFFQTCLLYTACTYASLLIRPSSSSSCMHARYIVHASPRTKHLSFTTALPTCHLHRLADRPRLLHSPHPNPTVPRRLSILIHIHHSFHLHVHPFQLQPFSYLCPITFLILFVIISPLHFPLVDTKPLHSLSSLRVHSPASRPPHAPHLAVCALHSCSTYSTLLSPPYP